MRSVSVGVLPSAPSSRHWDTRTVPLVKSCGPDEGCLYSHQHLAIHADFSITRAYQQGTGFVLAPEQPPRGFILWPLTSGKEGQGSELEAARGRHPYLQPVAHPVAPQPVFCALHQTRLFIQTEENRVVTNNFHVSGLVLPWSRKGREVSCWKFDDMWTSCYCLLCIKLLCHRISQSFYLSWLLNFSKMTRIEDGITDFSSCLLYKTFPGQRDYYLIFLSQKVFTMPTWASWKKKKNTCQPVSTINSSHSPDALNKILDVDPTWLLNLSIPDALADLSIRWDER